jgi:hypothetical protein
MIGRSTQSEIVEKNATISRGVGATYGGGVDSIPSAPISRACSPSAMVCDGVKVVQPTTTGILPPSSSTATSATRRRSARWLKEVALPIYASKHEVAKWLGHLFLTCDLSTQPAAFHGASYDDVMERQKPFFEQFCEAVFLDRMIDGKQYTFDYINETTAYAGYAALRKSLNNGRGIMGIRTFRPDLRDWLAEHAPHIERKEKWQGYSQTDHVRLWFNTRHLEKLRLGDSNDTKYLIGDPGRESWVGPSV